MLVRVSGPPARADAVDRPGWRLVACSPAGAGGWFFRPLVRDDVELLGVRYPGRENRTHEPYAASVPALAEELADALVEVLDTDTLPTVLLGHSMGAGVAAETAALVEERRPGRLALVVLSAREAPGRVDGHRLAGLRRTAASDLALRAWLGHLGGTPPELLADDELMALVLPVLRADLTISLDHDRMPGPVRTPVLTVSSTDDPEVSATDMIAWHALTRGGSSDLTLTGGHHALLAEADVLLARLRHLLAVTC